MNALQKSVLISVLITLGLLATTHFLPQFWWLTWPFVLISTVFHELGHGLAAILVGGQFESLKVWSDASGVAAHAVPNQAWRIALVAAAGPLGPPLTAAVLFLAARQAKSARVVLGLLAIILFVAATLWVRNLFGAGVFLVLASVLTLIAIHTTGFGAQLTLSLLGTQLALASFTRADYLFSAHAETANGLMPSDTAQIGQLLFLPYWFWGGLITLVSIAVLWWSVKRVVS